MSDAPSPAPSAAPTPPAAEPSGKGVKWTLILIGVSLLWYLLADRYTPYTQQARVQAFVIPVAAEVSGRVTRVLARNNQEVKAGEVLFEVDAEPYRIALASARANLETTRRQIGANTAGIDSAEAKLRAANANEVKARQDSDRLERLYSEDQGTISLRRLEVARAAHDEATSQVSAAQAEVERAREQQGGSDAQNGQLRSATAAVEKAELDLSNTRIRARSSGLVTDLRTDIGQFAAAGAPVMTLIAIHDVWVSADMTENNLGHLRPGTPVEMVLDSRPGELFRGRIRSISYGVSAGQPTPPGSLPTVQNSRDWLRPAQRFPVIVEFAPDETVPTGDIRVGGQVEVMAFPTSGNPLNPLGRVFLRVMSWLSYVY
ncbi:HlyD family secretion protein [Dyella solisilvae]|uniref:HlyD family secretion protein n=1 Tax=Dyella solisilvae TaxID=1920168 RepID=A0A370K486_9GAMM|nr:HlyD family secretion protein [Dyella solisilvae]RDI97473.1 HlyD family secretion protein [Dyella solisilvae]